MYYIVQSSSLLVHYIATKEHGNWLVTSSKRGYLYVQSIKLNAYDSTVQVDLQHGQQDANI
jgi:hypothetical protein